MGLQQLTSLAQSRVGFAPTSVDVAGAHRLRSARFRFAADTLNMDARIIDRRRGKKNPSILLLAYRVSDNIRD